MNKIKPEHQEHAIDLFLKIANDAFDVQPSEYMTGYQNMDGAHISGFEELKFILNSKNAFTNVIKTHPDKTDDANIEAIRHLYEQLNEFVQKADGNDEVIVLSHITWHDFLDTIEDPMGKTTHKSAPINAPDAKPKSEKSFKFGLTSFLNEEDSNFDKVIGLLELIVILLFVLAYAWITHH